LTNQIIREKNLLLACHSYLPKRFEMGSQEKHYGKQMGQAQGIF